MVEHTGDRVLGHENSDDSDVGRGSSLSPADWIKVTHCDSRPIVEGAEDELGRLMGRSFGDDRDGEAEDSETVESDRDVVEVRQDFHSERVDETVGNDESEVDRDGFT